MSWVRAVWDWVIEGTRTSEEITKDFHRYVNQVTNFINWHYIHGSKYDTPFWEEARNLKVSDPLFHSILTRVKQSSMLELIDELYASDSPRNTYGGWDPYSFKNWHDGMTKEQNGNK